MSIIFIKRVRINMTVFLTWFVYSENIKWCWLFSRLLIIMCCSVLLTVLFWCLSKCVKRRHSLILTSSQIILLISLRISRHRRTILLSCSKTSLKLTPHIAWLLSSHHHMSSIGLLLITHLTLWHKTYRLILNQLLT